MRKTTRRRVKTLIALSLIGWMIYNLSSSFWEEENLLDKLEQHYEKN